MKLREALAELRQPSARPRLVNVVGTSCTGKTRTLYEAVDQVLADWTLVKPADNDELTRMLYAGIPKHTVVWLDELQDFLTTQGVDAAPSDPPTPRRQRQSTNPVRGNHWPSNLSTLEQRPDPADARIGLGEISSLVRDSASDRYAVPNSFANDELRTVSRDDPRIARAIQYAADGPLTQVLAGGTQLVRRVYTDQQPTSHEVAVCGFCMLGGGRCELHSDGPSSSDDDVMQEPFRVAVSQPASAPEPPLSQCLNQHLNRCLSRLLHPHLLLIRSWNRRPGWPAEDVT